jgi:hypothetical protein
MLKVSPTFQGGVTGKTNILNAVPEMLYLPGGVVDSYLVNRKFNVPVRTLLRT